MQVSREIIRTRVTHNKAFGALPRTVFPVIFQVFSPDLCNIDILRRIVDYHIYDTHASVASIRIVDIVKNGYIEARGGVMRGYSVGIILDFN